MAIMKLRESLFIFVVWRDNWREFVPEFVSSYWIDSTELIHSVSSFPYPSILQLRWRNEFLKSTISTIFFMLSDSMHPFTFHSCNKWRPERRWAIWKAHYIVSIWTMCDFLPDVSSSIPFLVIFPVTTGNY